MAVWNKLWKSSELRWAKGQNEADVYANYVYF